MSETPTVQGEFFLVMAIFDKEEHLDKVLRALAKRGHGATFLHSLGMGRGRKEMSAADVPLIASLSRLLEQRRAINVTLFTVVSSEAAVSEVIGIVEEVVGTLDRPHAGLAFAIPISHVSGFFQYMPHQLDA